MALDSDIRVACACGVWVVGCASHGHTHGPISYIPCKYKQALLRHTASIDMPSGVRGIWAPCGSRHQHQHSTPSGHRPWAFIYTKGNVECRISNKALAIATRSQPAGHLISYKCAIQSSAYICLVVQLKIPLPMMPTRAAADLSVGLPPALKALPLYCVCQLSSSGT
jgi:hypothetical protein